MKPIFRTGRPARDDESRSTFGNNIQTAPTTDWSYQAAPTLRGGAGSFGKNRASFRALSNSFFEAEAKREDRIEAVAFGLIVALATWPMVQAAQALFHLIK